ncbi:DNA-binding protein P3A2-like isoform X2 [Anthonomus grandis grandis]|uniref:DNA-binding protein P3A2-like isoform X2 n=1 Tax=Anthonomus grandis grandis TaxID=2921223 RepID=UPI002166B197|nr:DNA-binding protein P3A2-like isoform X2 [Anthonomus grandis grandis]
MNSDAERPSSAEYENTYFDSDLMAEAMADGVTAQLATAGPVGVAAAAAIVSTKRRMKKPPTFETDPSIRKRYQTRILLKLRRIIDEYTTKVGQQVVILAATPGNLPNGYRVFGAKPLEGIIQNLKETIMEELEQALTEQAPLPIEDDPTLFELPPLMIDGIPTPVENMTQAQLRAFIPLMMKYATGRGKPGWGKKCDRPPWWPKEAPWANIRKDERTQAEKQKVPWRCVLMEIVTNCYKFFGREDLLPTYVKSNKNNNADTLPNTSIMKKFKNRAVIKARHDPVIDNNMQVNSNGPISIPNATDAPQSQNLETAENNTCTDNTMQPISEGSVLVKRTDENSVLGTSVNSGSQLILSAENVYGVTANGSLITVPVTPSMYTAIVTNIQGLYPKNADNLDQHGVPEDVKVESNIEENMVSGDEALTSSSSNPKPHTILIVRSGNDGTQVCQVLYLNDGKYLSNEMQHTEVKTE